MRTRLTALFLVVFALVSSLTSQTSTDPNEGLIFTHDASDDHFTLSWWGRAGKTYYVQHSSDLIAWEWVLDASAVASGADDILQMSLQTNAKSGFFRLVITDNNAMPAAWLTGYGLNATYGPNDDPDGDGLTNAQEYISGSNPNNADTDGDGFSDSVEVTWSTDPLVASDNPASTGQQHIWMERIEEQNSDGSSAVQQEYRDGYPGRWNIGQDWQISGQQGHTLQENQPAPTLPTLHAVPAAELPASGAAWNSTLPYPVSFTNNPTWEPFSASVGGDGAGYASFETAASFSKQGTQPSYAVFDSWELKRSYLRLRTNIPSLQPLTRAYLKQNKSWTVTQPGLSGNGYGSPVLGAATTMNFTIAAGETVSAVTMCEVPVETNRLHQQRVQPVVIEQPILSEQGSEIIMGDQTDGLRLCRWESPRNNYGRLQDRSAFPQNDPDRIRISFDLSGQPQDAPLSLHLRTTGAPTDHPEYNDAGATMNFTQTSAGHFVSEPFVLVADADDDALPVGPNLVADGDPGDRTFIAYPGGKLIIEGVALSQPIEVPIKRHTHKIRYEHIFAGNISGNNIASAMFENRYRCPGIYNQVHLRCDEESASQQIPANDTDLMAIYEDNKLTLNELSVIVAKVDAMGLPPEVIKVIWVPISISGFLPSLTVAYNYNAGNRKDLVFMFLSELAKTPATANDLGMSMAHEIGHSLRGSGHRENGLTGDLLPGYHLMAEDGGNKIHASDPDLSTKHWYIRESESIKVAPAQHLTP